MKKDSRNGALTARPRRGSAVAKGAVVPSTTADSSEKAAISEKPEDPLPPASTTTVKQPSKQELLASMLLADAGATLDQMVDQTSWLKHTVRAALTGLKKKGYVISSDKVEGVRTYRAVAPE